MDFLALSGLTLAPPDLALLLMDHLIQQKVSDRSHITLQYISALTFSISLLITFLVSWLEPALTDLVTVLVAGLELVDSPTGGK